MFLGKVLEIVNKTAVLIQLVQLKTTFTLQNLTVTKIQFPLSSVFL